LARIYNHKLLNGTKMKILIINCAPIWLYLQKNLYPLIIASITECQTGQGLFFLITNKKIVTTSALGTITKMVFAVPDERNTLTKTKLDPLCISYILHELPCSDRYLWPN